MSRPRHPSDRPIKTCPVCQRPFSWRKKWADCWEEVRYCSERCRRRRSSGKSAALPPEVSGSQDSQ